jgi:CBS domain-containing protein
MIAQDWMTRPVHTCRPETSMSEAARLMWEKDCGVLPVVNDDRKVVGMITDRDLCMGAFLRGRSLQDLKVKDSMTRTVVTCLPSDSIEQVIRDLGDTQVRRIPVVDGRGRLVGILSLNDLARRLVTLDERERARLAPRFLEALASICETRECAAMPEVVPQRAGEQQPQMVG